jgi:hypothetical protein
MMNSLSPQNLRNSRLSRGQSSSSSPTRHRFDQSSRWLIAGAIATVGLLSGVAPGWQGGQLALSSSAMAQSKKPVTAEHVANFVRAAMSMEPKRKQAVQEIQAAMGSVPAIRCDNRNSFNELDPAVRSVAINYCNESKRIVEASGLSVERFNEILVEQKSNSELRDRIQSEICRVDANLCRKK